MGGAKEDLNVYDEVGLYKRLWPSNENKRQDEKQCKGASEGSRSIWRTMSASFKSKSAPIRFWIPCRSACLFLQRSLGLRKMCLMNLGRNGEMGG